MGEQFLISSCERGCTQVFRCAQKKLSDPYSALNEKNRRMLISLEILDYVNLFQFVLYNFFRIFFRQRFIKNTQYLLNQMLVLSWYPDIC